MNDAGLMRCRQCGPDLLDNLGDERWCEMSRTVDEFGQRLAFSPLQRQIVKAVGLSVVVCANDVGVTYPRAVLRFPKKPFDCNGVSGKAGAKDLHRRCTTFGVLGAIDGRCPAFADISLEVVTGDSPTDQRISVHSVAKLLNTSERSKLSRPRFRVLDASRAPPLTFDILQSC